MTASLLPGASRGEGFRPLPNRPRRGIPGTLRFQLRLFLDFQVHSVHRALRDFLPPGNPGKVLEVGGGLSPYRHLIRTGSYWSLDPYGLEGEFDGSAKSVKYDGAAFPFKTGRFDILLHTEVLEHVFDTARFLAECRRVLKPGGSMFFTVPFSARYHYQPHDYWRFTPSSLRRICAAQGFEVRSVSARGDSLTVILNKVMVLLLELALGRSRKGPSRLLHAALFLPLALAALPALAALGHVLLRAGWPGHPDDCLGYSVVCVKPSA